MDAEHWQDEGHRDETQDEALRSRQTFAAAIAAQMKTPLSRVELAASQLMRDALTPANRRLASRVSDAAEDLDALIGRLLALLAPGAKERVVEGDLREVIDSLHRRLSPVLAARGIEWAEPASDQGRALVGDQRRSRRAALMLLRSAAKLVGSGGRLAIEGVIEGSECAVRLIAHAGDRGLATTASIAVGELRTAALRDGGRLEERYQGEEVQLTWWMLAPSPEPSPSGRLSCAGAAPETLE